MLCENWGDMFGPPAPTASFLGSDDDDDDDDVDDDDGKVPDGKALEKAVGAIKQAETKPSARNTQDLSSAMPSPAFHYKQCSKSEALRRAAPL